MKNSLKQKTHFSVWRLTALLGLALYLILALYQLHLPGLNYDEALDVGPAAQVLSGAPADGTATLVLFGRRWPLMTMPYIGVTTTYFVMPVFGLFGVSALSLRGAAVFLGVISLILSWGFLRSYFDERIAAGSVLLLAVSPSFVFWTRMGAWVQLTLVPIAISAIWLLFRWYTTGRGRNLIAGCFMLGLGLATHIRFAWIWGALLVAWLLFSPRLSEGKGVRRWLWPLERASVRTWTLSALALLLGMTPLILYNLQDLSFLSYTKDVFLIEEREWLGASGQEPSILGMALSSFETFLSGDWFNPHFGGSYSNPLGVAAFALALLVIAALAAAGRLSYPARRVALLITIVAVVAVASVAIRSRESAHHLVLLWPMPQALVAVAFFSLADWLTSRAAPERRNWLALGMAMVALILISAELRTTLLHHRALTTSGGVGHFSDAIYALQADLDQSGAARPVAMDWGFRRNMQILTANRVDPVEWFAYSTPPAPDFVDDLAQLVSVAPDATYLFHAPRYTAFPGHWDLFQEAAYRNGLEPVLIKTYYQRDGQPVILTYVLRPAGRIFAAPHVERPLDVQLGDVIAFLGYDLPAANAQPGGDLPLTLYWQAQGLPEKSYKVFVHLFDDNGKLWAQHDSPPVYGSRPTDDWQDGEVVPDRIHLSIPADLPPGTYHLFIGMYDEATGERLPLVSDGVRLQGDTLGLADITVP